MSQASPEYIDTEIVPVPGTAVSTGGLQHPPQRAPNQAPHGMSDLVDGSGAIFSMYLERAEEEDKKMAENWKADAEGTLVFTGLFSAAVASFISVSIQDIRPNPQDTSNFYLANIYQTIADPNRSNISSFLPSSPPPFSPPNYAVWVNALWFMSLVISLTCALLATLLQQWARKYLRVTQPRYSSPLKRARIRTFFSEGVEGCLLPWVVEALPTLLHVSLFLFFAGLVVFLRSINLPIFKSVLSWVGVCIALYGCITFMPVLRRDSPYHTPLSPLARAISVAVLAWSGQWVLLFAGAYYLIRCHLRRETSSFWKLFCSFGERIWKFVKRVLKTAEEIALDSPSELDARAFMWTFDSLNEDDELEDFFSGLAGFRRSKVVKDPLPSLTPEQRQKLSRGFIGLLDRTFSSDLVPEPVKKQRAMICAKATDPAHIPKAFDVVHKILTNYQYSGPLATDIVQIVRGWDSSNMDEDATWDAQATISMIVARVQPRDDSWFILASRALDVPESVLRDYATNGNSLSLAILIHATRQQFSHLRDPWPYRWFAVVLKAASTFNVQDSSPELQHEFCVLWNRIVLKAQTADVNRRPMAWHILRPIRNIYIALHQDTDSAPKRFSPSTGDMDDILLEPFSYPVCDVAGHIHGHSLSTDTAFVRAAAQAPASLSSSNAPSSPVPARLRVDESLTDVPLLENVHCAHQTTTHSLRNSVTSLDIATTGVMRDTVSSGITMLTSPTSTSTLLSPTSPPAAFALQRNSDPLTPPDPPNLSYPASPRPVLVNIVPTDPPLSSHSPIARSNFSPSFLESHHSITVITAPSPSPGPISSTEDDDNLKLSSCKGKDSLESPSLNRAMHANTVAVLLDFPPQLPSGTDPDVATARRSLRGLTPERTGVLSGDHPPHPSHCPYDMV